MQTEELIAGAAQSAARGDVLSVMLFVLITLMGAVVFVFVKYFSKIPASIESVSDRMDQRQIESNQVIHANTEALGKNSEVMRNVTHVLGKVTDELSLIRRNDAA